MVKTILITGKNGQLGWEINQITRQYPQFNFVFVDVDELDLSRPETVSSFFQKYHPDYFVHCAAYTAVDKAETEKQLAYKINAESVGVIAKECAKINCPLIFISTDYVFNGNGTAPYKTNQQAEPLNYYGYTKHIAEKLAAENWNKTLIIRTAWVYSTHGHNFVKTMLRLMNERNEIKVVNDQIGSPTYAADLAKAILQIVLQWHNGNEKFGTYHYTNSGIISWYNFAAEIKALSGLSCSVLPVVSSEYPTPAKRPSYSVMDTHNIVDDFGIELQDWKTSLQKCVAALSA